MRNAGARVLVYGLGRSGVAACRLLRAQGHEVLYFDEAPQPHETLEVEILGCKPSPSPREAEVNVCIAAPGVAWTHPDLAALRGRDIETIGEVEWVYRTTRATIIGVTGTAGKTTVTRWVSDTLQAAGFDAPAGGNIGPALAAVALDVDKPGLEGRGLESRGENGTGTILVTELSSFQLERCPTLKPKVAVVLNLGRDHLDRHGSVENYHAAKRALVAHLDKTDTFVYNADDPVARAWAEASRAKTLGFSVTSEADAHLEPGESGDVLTLHGRALLPVRDLRVRGRHFYANALAVALVGAAYGLDDEALRESLTRFEGVAGRYSVVGTLGSVGSQVTFVEDSIATRTLSVRAALEATPGPIVWIGGGVDKGAEFEELEALVREKVVLFIGVGRSGPDFAKRLSAWTDTALCSQENGDAALHCACERGLERLGANGGTVLLAPLAASFDQFRDYRARAEAFRRAVGVLEAHAPSGWGEGRAWTVS